jgi:hypothetical protein
VVAVRAEASEELNWKNWKLLCRILWCKGNLLLPKKHKYFVAEIGRRGT